MLSKLSIGLLVLASLFGLSKPATPRAVGAGTEVPDMLRIIPPTLRIIRPTTLPTTLITATRMATATHTIHTTRRDLVSASALGTIGN